MSKTLMNLKGMLGSIWANYSIDSQTQLTASVATMTHEGNESANTIISNTPVAGRV